MYPEHPEQLSSLLLMRRLALPSRYAYLVREGKIDLEFTNDEFSIFMFVGGNIATKQANPSVEIGKLVRTKPASS